MKHLLNDLSEKEKNSIREQHTDKLKVDTSKFKKLMESKLGDVKPMVEQSEQKPSEGPVLPQVNTNTNQSIEIPKGTQEPESFEGKSITLYRDNNEAIKAFESKKSNPRSPWSITGVIDKIHHATDDGVNFSINVYNLAKDPNGPSAETQVKYFKQTGSFKVDGRGDSDYYNEGLKQALDKKYYQTDFASTQKPMGTMTEQNSIGGKVNNISKDLESGDILIVKDKDNKVSNLQVVSSQPPAGLTAKNPMGKMSKFIIGPQDNQLRAPETMPGDFVFTVSKVKVGDKTVDVDESGNFSF